MPMTVKCVATKEAAAVLCEMGGIKATPVLENIELEFKELPYFLVRRSQMGWKPEMGDINVVQVLWASKEGIVVNPNHDSGVLDAADQTQAKTHVLIPWSNITSITLERG